MIEVRRDAEGLKMGRERKVRFVIQSVALRTSAFRNDRALVSRDSETCAGATICVTDESRTVTMVNNVHMQAGAIQDSRP